MELSVHHSNGGSHLKFTDVEVCKPFLLGICINEFFTDTRLDLGQCTKVHSLALRAEYEKISASHSYEFEQEIETNRQHLGQLENPESEAKVQVMRELGAQIDEKMTKSEALVAEGKIDESQAVLAEVGTLKARKKEIEDDYRNNCVMLNSQQPHQWQPPNQQLLQVCEVCGSFISLSNDDSRLMHYNSRLHTGILTVKERTKLLEEAVEQKIKLH